MKNTAINSLKYTGIVTLSQYIGSKKVKIAQVHNEGGNTLFNFFADCLAGDFTLAAANRPNKIALIRPIGTLDKYGNDDFEFLTNSSGFTFVLTAPEKNISKIESRVVYSFLLEKNKIENINDFTNVYLGLYPSYTKDDELGAFSALCKLDFAKNIVIKSALVVDWELIVSNISAQA